MGHLPHNRDCGFPITIKHGEVMRRLFATVSNFACVPSRTLLGASTVAFAALFGQFQAAALPAGILHAQICDSEDAFGYMPGRSTSGDMPCPVHPRPSSEIAEARAYLLETASPGFTMSKQGPELAIERLHPEFAMRLANAIREAREQGLPSVGVFSAYRPPAFGIGGFSDKFNSLHAYGLAVDMAGIGGPGSEETRHWHQIAAKNGVICPYGPFNRAEWNHCQPTGLKVIVAQSPLRHTITAAGPVDLEGMFEVGTAIIEGTGHVDDPETVGSIKLAAAATKPVAAAKEAPTVRRVAQHVRSVRSLRRTLAVAARTKLAERSERAESSRRSKSSERSKAAARTKVAANAKVKRNVRVAARRSSKDDDD
jgi:hypothetical protein